MQRASSRVVESQNQGEEVMSLSTFDAFGGSGWDLLPPYEEVVEGCKVFITSYFQLGFLPKTIFFERLQKKKEEISVFLLLSILSISARFTPSLVKLYGGGQNATDFFLENAAIMVLDHMYKPSLENIQAFFLISLAEWGKGDKDRSSTHLGIAVRMAGGFRLHREEAYRLPDNATAEDVVESEVARRTFWMLENHENLHSGFNSPVSFSLNDITTLLPCEEQEFAFGVPPIERAALMGTAPALKDDRLTKSPSRSLFATLIQSHNFWGQISRLFLIIYVVQRDSTRPEVETTTLSQDEYIQLSTSLKDFDEHLPHRYRWSVWNLRGFKTEGLDLAYLSIVMMIRLSNIILRRSYLHSLDTGGTASSESASGLTMTITEELFTNMVILHEQIEAYFSLRSPNQGFPAFIVFCIYICGSLANHLQKRDSRTVARAVEILQASTKLLSEVQDAWPMAKRWSDALIKAYQRQVQSHSTSTHTAANNPPTPTIPQTTPQLDNKTHSSSSNNHHNHTSPTNRFPPLSRSISHHADRSTTTTTLVVVNQHSETATPDDDDDDNFIMMNQHTSSSSSSSSLLQSQHDPPWHDDDDRVSARSLLSDNFDSELAFYLWPAGAGGGGGGGDI